MRLVATLLGLFLLHVCASSDVHSDVTALHGIPYAKPPLKTLRFKDPEPLDDGAHMPRKKDIVGCFQMKRGKLAVLSKQSEDCLYLSLFIPTTVNANTNVDLLVLFSNDNPGSAELASLVRADLAIALVSFREGFFGFFQDSVAGIKDIQLALTILREKLMPTYSINGKVTVMAEHEAASILSHVSDMDESVLFDRAVLLDGNKYVGRFKQRRAIVERNAQRLLRTTECDLPSQSQALDCLRTKTIKELQESLEKMSIEEVHGAPFQPLMEAKVKNLVPTIVSSQTQLNSEFVSTEEFDINYSYSNFKRFLHYLIPESEYSNAPLLRRLALYEYVYARGSKTDTYFLFEQTRKMIQDNHYFTKTFEYVMDLSPETNSVWLLEHDQSDVLKQCLFSERNEYNEALCNRVRQYITRFATKGEPTDGGCDPNNPSWPALKSQKRDYFLVLPENGQPEWEFDYHLRAIAFWSDLIPAMANIELAGKREATFEETPDLTAYEEQDDVQLWHNMEHPELTEEKALNDMPMHFEL